MNNTPQMRGKMPRYDHCQIEEDEIAALIQTDPILIGYIERERELDRRELEALAYETDAKDRLNQQHLKIAEAEATLTQLDREKRSIMGEIKQSKFRQASVVQQRAAIQRRWKQRELAIFKALLTKRLRSMNREILPKKYAEVLDPHE